MLVGCATAHPAPLPAEERWLEANGATRHYRTFSGGPTTPSINAIIGYRRAALRAGR
jgi:hypothetical protein